MSFKKKYFQDPLMHGHQMTSVDVEESQKSYVSIRVVEVVQHQSFLNHKLYNSIPNRIYVVIKYFNITSPLNCDCSFLSNALRTFFMAHFLQSGV